MQRHRLGNQRAAEQPTLIAVYTNIREAPLKSSLMSSFLTTHLC